MLNPQESIKATIKGVTWFLHQWVEQLCCFCEHLLSPVPVWSPSHHAVLLSSSWSFCHRPGKALIRCQGQHFSVTSFLFSFSCLKHMTIFHTAQALSCSCFSFPSAGLIADLYHTTTLNNKLLLCDSVCSILLQQHKVDYNTHENSATEVVTKILSFLCIFNSNGSFNTSF